MSDKKSDLVLSEFVGNNLNGCKYLVKADNKLSQLTRKASFGSIKDTFKQVFLPEGFPNSVSEDYVSYQIWDTVQAFCSSISGALAARAVFESIGVGDEAATAYGATLTWLIKDGTGMIGKIVFAWHQGTSLDSNSKMWRLYADILNDFSFFVDLLTPFAPKSYSIYCISFSGLLRSIVGIAGGATRSALTQHQAKNNNLADVSAKDSSQETLVNLMALIFNIMILSYVKDSKNLIWQLFILFVIGHLFSNYKAVKSVIMKTFNRNRFNLLLNNYFKTNSVSKPKEINKLEPVLRSVSHHIGEINLGCHISNLNDSKRMANEKVMNRFNDEKYLVEFDMKKRRVNVLLNEDHSHNDLLRALFQVEMVEYAMKNKEQHESFDFKHLRASINSNESESIELETSKLLMKHFDEFLTIAKKSGWSDSYTQFSPNIYKYKIANNKSA